MPQSKSIKFANCTINVGNSTFNDKNFTTTDHLSIKFKKISDIQNNNIREEFNFQALKLATSKSQREMV